MTARFETARFEEEQRRRDEQALLRQEALALGVEIDLGETVDGLRERVEAARSGNRRALSVASWASAREQKTQQREAAVTLAIVNGTSLGRAEAVIGSVQQKGRIHVTVNGLEQFRELAEVAREAAEAHARNPCSATFNGQPIPATQAPREGTIEVKLGNVTAQATYRVKAPEDLRAENRRLGEEIAKAPPSWAYPLAWRLAVMAVVEDYNCREKPRTFQQAWEDAYATESLRTYHGARMSGQTEKTAMAAVRKVAGLIGVTLAIACQAYERGRPGPGGVHLGRPA